MARILPPDTTRFVQSMLINLVGANHKAWLSFGMVGIIWVASSAFDAVIEALDITYDVKSNRPMWKTRLLALVLGGICVTLLIVALAVMIVGPEFGTWLAARIPVSQGFVVLWPLLHWSIAISFTVLAVETVYFLAPNVKQSFLGTLPGAILASDLLDRSLLSARRLFPSLRQLQPHLRNPGGIHRLPDVALLECVCAAARSGIEREASQRKRPAERKRKEQEPVQAATCVQSQYRPDCLTARLKFFP